MTTTRAAAGPDAQPVSAVQWLLHGDLSANQWNPNRQAPTEHRLLKISILESGWTQPIVAREQEDGTLEIVDGYHRWSLAADPDLAALTNGLVPVVVLPPTNPAAARMATVRHNRARGTHHVLRMADIVHDLLDDGLTPEEIGTRLGMDDEEVERLAHRGKMTARHNAGSFNDGWTI